MAEERAAVLAPGRVVVAVYAGALRVRGVGVVHDALALPVDHDYVGVLAGQPLRPGAVSPQHDVEPEV